MKTLISIISHQAGGTWRAAIRETWLRDQAVDYRFILGDGAEIQHDDELLVPAPDCYAGILQKVRKVCEWAELQSYDYLFTCFTDTYVNVARLLSSGFEAHPYSGHVPKQYGDPRIIDLIPDEKGRFPYASGGAGYWLDRRSMGLTARTDPPAEIAAMGFDDLWIGTLLGSHGIAGFHDPRYGFKGTHLSTPQQISVHLSQGTGQYDPEWMLRAHDWSV